MSNVIIITVFNNTLNKRKFSQIASKNDMEKDSDRVFVSDSEHNTRGTENNETMRI